MSVARHPLRRTFGATFVVMLAAGCGAPAVQSGGSGGGNNSPPASPSPEAAPWSGQRVGPAGVPQVYYDVWDAAENRNRCPLIAPAASPASDATARSATFSGGWAVAYDRPGLRSAFGVAGTGVDTSGSIYDDWPYHIDWADGSSAGYGPEGGTGPQDLAYLRIAGVDCLYNVWSNQGVEELERLLESLRFVNVG